MLEKIVGKNLSEMVVPEENLWEIYGSLPHAYDAWKHLCTDFLGDYAENPETFQGLKSGKRNTEKQASLYDAMLAEICAERDGEKAKVRNRRKEDRKHKVLPKERKHREEMRKDRMFGYYYNENCPKVMFAPDSLPIKYRKDAESDRIARADFDAEIHQHEDAMQEYADYCLMAEQHEERLEYLRNLTGNVEFWEIMIDEISREKIYEENRIIEMRNIANTIMKGECY